MATLATGNSPITPRTVVKENTMSSTSLKTPRQTLATELTRNDLRKCQYVWPDQNNRVHMQQLNVQADEYCRHPVGGNVQGPLKVLLFDNAGPSDPGTKRMLCQMRCCNNKSRNDLVSSPRNECRSHQLSDIYSGQTIWS